jgi:8-oxo-dGTP pyrophosphatase MutT (NUDIX family)
MEKKLSCAAVIFWDSGTRRVVLQKVGADSKYGDKQHFFGGKMEQGEIPEQTIKRELEEELEYSPAEIQFWKKYEYRIEESGNHFDGWDITMNMFRAPITEKLLSCPVHEGEGMICTDYKEALEMSGWGKNNKIILTEFAKEFFG